MTDGFIRLFANNCTPVALGRNLGLLAMDTSASGKHLLAQQAMGLTGRLPRLARGLALV